MHDVRTGPLAIERQSNKDVCGTSGRDSEVCHNQWGLEAGGRVVPRLGGEYIEFSTRNILGIAFRMLMTAPSSMV